MLITGKTRLVGERREGLLPKGRKEWSTARRKERRAPRSRRKEHQADGERTIGQGEHHGPASQILRARHSDTRNRPQNYSTDFVDGLSRFRKCIFKVTGSFGQQYTNHDLRKLKLHMTNNSEYDYTGCIINANLRMTDGVIHPLSQNGSAVFSDQSQLFHLISCLILYPRLITYVHQRRTYPYSEKETSKITILLFQKQRAKMKRVWTLSRPEPPNHAGR